MVLLNLALCSLLGASSVIAQTSPSHSTLPPLDGEAKAQDVSPVQARDTPNKTDQPTTPAHQTKASVFIVDAPDCGLYPDVKACLDSHPDTPPPDEGLLKHAPFQYNGSHVTLLRDTCNYSTRGIGQQDCTFHFDPAIPITKVFQLGSEAFAVENCARWQGRDADQDCHVVPIPKPAKVRREEAVKPRENQPASRTPCDLFPDVNACLANGPPFMPPDKGPLHHAPFQYNGANVTVPPNTCTYTNESIGQQECAFDFDPPTPVTKVFQLGSEEFWVENCSQWPDDGYQLCRLIPFSNPTKVRREASAPLETQEKPAQSERPSLPGNIAVLTHEPFKYKDVQVTVSKCGPVDGGTDKQDCTLHFAKKIPITEVFPLGDEQFEVQNCWSEYNDADQKCRLVPTGIGALRRRDWIPASPISKNPELNHKRFEYKGVNITFHSCSFYGPEDAKPRPQNCLLLTPPGSDFKATEVFKAGPEPYNVENCAETNGGNGWLPNCNLVPIPKAQKLRRYEIDSNGEPVERPKPGSWNLDGDPSHPSTTFRYQNSDVTVRAYQLGDNNTFQACDFIFEPAIPITEVFQFDFKGQTYNAENCESIRDESHQRCRIVPVLQPPRLRRRDDPASQPPPAPAKGDAPAIPPFNYKGSNVTFVYEWGSDAATGDLLYLFNFNPPVPVTEVFQFSVGGDSYNAENCITKDNNLHHLCRGVKIAKTRRDSYPGLNKAEDEAVRARNVEGRTEEHTSADHDKTTGSYW